MSLCCTSTVVRRTEIQRKRSREAHSDIYPRGHTLSRETTLCHPNVPAESSRTLESSIWIQVYFSSFLHTQGTGHQHFRACLGFRDVGRMPHAPPPPPPKKKKKKLKLSKVVPSGSRIVGQGPHPCTDPARGSSPGQGSPPSELRVKGLGSGVWGLGFRV